MACKLNAVFCKVGLVLVVGFSLFLWGCSSVPTDSIDPAEIEYQEMDAGEYCGDGFYTMGSDYPVQDQEFLRKLYSKNKGYLLSDAYLLGVEHKEVNGITETIVTIGGKFYNEFIRHKYMARSEVYGNDFIKDTLQDDPTWIDRVNAIKDNEKLNGRYKVWLYATGGQGNFWSGYTPITVNVYKIEGIPTQEEIDAVIAEQAAEEAAAEAERIAQEEAEKRAKAEKIEQLNARGRQLAKGYTFHGIEEDELSCKLFTNGALEPGHAYLISGFVVQYGGSYAAIEYGDGFFFSSRSSSVIVSYASQQVKAEIINAGVTSLLGQTIETPLTVVVAAGTGYSGTPVVLGLVEE